MSKLRVFPEHPPEKSASMFTDVPSTTVPLSDHRQFVAVHGGGLQAPEMHPYVHVVLSHPVRSDLHVFSIFPSHVFVSAVHAGALHPSELSHPYKQVVPSQLYPSEEHSYSVDPTPDPSHFIEPGVHILLHLALELSQPLEHVSTFDEE
jgi:hypothetical protein